MKLSPRTLTTTGIAFVLLAVLFVFLKEKHGMFSETEDNSRGKTASNGSDTRERDSRIDPKRLREKSALSSDDPEVQKQAERWYQELLTRHPELQIEFKSIPDEENGFFQFNDLIEKLSPGEPWDATLPMKDDLRDMIEGKTAFEPEKLEEWIASNKELFQRILMIAEAPDQSVKGSPFEQRTLSASRPATEISRLLQAAAHSTFENGNPDEALRYHLASLNFANHFAGLEIPNLWDSHHVTKFRNEAVENFHQNILPGLVDDPPTLAKWRKSLPVADDISDLSQLLFKSSWHISARQSLLPALIAGPDLTVSEDQYPTIDTKESDAIVEAYTSLIKDHIRQASDLTLQNLTDWSRISLPEGLQLSEDGYRAAHMALSYPDQMIRNFGNQASFLAQHDALLAIALGEEPPLEPITGEPFLWDPETRTLSPPAALDEYKLDIKPLKLPDAR